MVAVLANPRRALNQETGDHKGRPYGASIGRRSVDMMSERGLLPAGVPLLANGVGTGYISLCGACVGDQQPRREFPPDYRDARTAAPCARSVRRSPVDPLAVAARRVGARVRGVAVRPGSLLRWRQRPRRVNPPVRIGVASSTRACVMVEAGSTGGGGGSTGPGSMDGGGGGTGTGSGVGAGTTTGAGVEGPCPAQAPTRSPTATTTPNERPRALAGALSSPIP